MTDRVEERQEHQGVHRLKNHLTIILGFAELLLEDLPAGSAQRADVEEIKKAALEALRQTNDIAKELTHD